MEDPLKVIITFDEKILRDFHNRFVYPSHVFVLSALFLFIIIEHCMAYSFI